MVDEPITGGCFCGAIRYQSTDPPVRVGMCHCRMCQRWFGAAACMGVFFESDSFRFTKGEPKIFMTSAILERRFCENCGTSILHRYVAGPLGRPPAATVDGTVGQNPYIVYLGTLDRPEGIPAPQFHFGIESHLDKWLILEEGVPQLQAEGDPRLAKAWEEVGEDHPERPGSRDHGRFREFRRKGKLG